MSSKNSTSIFSRNLQALAKSQPELAESLRTLPEETGNVTVRPARDGTPTLEIRTGEGRSTLLHSGYAPLKEAERLVDSYSVRGTENLVVLGLALGHHLVEILSRPANRDFILAVERDPAVFRAFLAVHDLSAEIESGRLSFAIGWVPQRIFHFLQIQAFTILENGVKAIKHPPSVKLDSGYYESVLRSVSELVVWAKVNTNSQIRSGRKYAWNTFENVPELLRNHGVKVLENAFRGRPAIVVSAGPSLTKNIRQLKIAHGKAVIICVDTALKVLLSHGIRPDLVVSIDFTPHNRRYFDGVDTSDLTLVADLEVHPDILSGFQGKKLIMNLPGKSLCEWLAGVLGDFGLIDKGLSVAHSAFLLGLYMGCDSIALIGQDLAYSDDMSHARGTSMSRVEKAGEQGQNIVRVGDVFGGTTTTPVSMHVFLKHFEDLIHDRKEKLRFECYDATEGGAKIAGTKIISLREFIVRHCGGDFAPAVEVNRLISSGQGIVAEDLLNRCVETSQRLGKIAEISKAGSKLVSDIEEEFNRRDATGDILVRFGRKYAEISRSLLKYRQEMNVLKDVAVEEMVLQAKKMPVDDNREAMADFLARTRKFYAGLADSARFLSQRFGDLPERLVPAGRTA